MKREFTCNDREYALNLDKQPDGRLLIEVSGRSHEVSLERLKGNELAFSIDGVLHKAFVSQDGPAFHVSIAGSTFTVFRKNSDASAFASPGHAAVADPNRVVSPLPGRIIKVNARPGDSVRKDDCLVVMESMKMETSLFAPRDAQVAIVVAVSGALVEAGAVLLEFQPAQ